MRVPRTLTVAVLISALGAAPAFSFDPGAVTTARSSAADRAPVLAVPGEADDGPKATTRRRDQLAHYRGLAAWVDIYDRGPWRRPIAAVERMARRGVKTLFLQTANYGLHRPVYRPAQIDRFLRAAHKRNIAVIAWYVPSFAHPKVDLFRTLRAIRYRSAHGHRFDGFAMDIEATVVDNIEVRNRRLLRLSARVRHAVGSRYVLGAIVPDWGARYWPGFPYAQVYELYDVFLPMTYYTFRTRGPARVERFVAGNVGFIRQRTGDPKTPVHPIGGLAGDTSVREVKGFVRAVAASSSLGGSLYDFPITSTRAWRALRPLARAGVGLGTAKAKANRQPRPPQRRPTAERVRGADR